MKMIKYNIEKYIAVFLLFALTITSWGEYWHFHKSNLNSNCEIHFNYSNQTNLSFNQLLSDISENTCSLCKVIRSFDNNYFNADILSFNIENNHFFNTYIAINYFEIDISSVLNKSPPSIS